MCKFWNARFLQLVEEYDEAVSDIDFENVEYDASKWLKFLVEEGECDVNVLMKMLNKRTIWANYDLLTKAGAKIDLSKFHFTDDFVLKNVNLLLERGYPREALLKAVLRKLDGYLERQNCDIQGLADQLVVVIGKEPKPGLEELVYGDLCYAGAKIPGWEPKKEE